MESLIPLNIPPQWEKKILFQLEFHNSNFFAYSQQSEIYFEKECDTESRQP
jgi:hypothetical protein